MAQPLGNPQDPTRADAARPALKVEKKKGCRRKKCSHWKGGKCRCGRE